MWLNLIMHKGIRAPGYRRGILRAEADSYANPIPSFRFWSFRKNKYHSWNIETGFLFGDGARVIRFFDGVIQQLGFWTQKIQANIDYCHVRRRAECTSLGPGLEHPSLRSDSMSGREETCQSASRGIFSRKHPSPA